MEFPYWVVSSSGVESGFEMYFDLGYVIALVCSLVVAQDSLQRIWFASM